MRRQGLTRRRFRQSIYEGRHDIRDGVAKRLDSSLKLRKRDVLAEFGQGRMKPGERRSRQFLEDLIPPFVWGNKVQPNVKVGLAGQEIGHTEKTGGNAGGMLP